MSGMGELDADAACAAAAKLKDAMFNVRRDACKSLAKAGHLAEPYLEQLKEISEKDDDHEVKKAARNAIRELKEQGVELKKEEVKAPDPEQQKIDEQNQVWATRAGKQLQDKSWNVRKDACKRLGTVGRFAEPYLQRLTELLQDERQEVRKAAEAALKKLREGGIFLPEPEVHEEPPAAPEATPAAVPEEAGEQYSALVATFGAADGLDFAQRQEVWSDEAAQPKPQPQPEVQVDMGPAWWESMPGGPAWDPDGGQSYESVLLEEQMRERVVRKEAKVELNEDTMMLEAAQSAAEEIQDISNVVRKDACKVFGGLGKYAKPYLQLIAGTAEKDPSPDVRLAAKSALKELREDGVGGIAAPSGSKPSSAKPDPKVSVHAPSPSWTGPVANFRIFDEVVPMLLESASMTPNEVVKVWESWGIRGAGRARFQLMPSEGCEQAEREAAATCWMNPREDVLPLAPAVVRLEAKVGSVLSSLAVALKGRIGQEDAYREERLNRRRDPRSKLWIEGPPMLKRSTAASAKKKDEEPKTEPKDID